MSGDEIQSGRKKLYNLAVAAKDKLTPLSDIEFGFNRASVQWVDGFIERLRAQSISEETRSGLIGSLGSFLGECVVQATHGEWHWSDQDQTWGILLATEAWVFPFAKVAKQFKNGSEAGDSITGFYDVAVHYIATNQFSRKA